MRPTRSLRWLTLGMLALACAPQDTGDDPADDEAIPLRPKANPTEYTGFTVERALEGADARAVLAPLFGLDGLSSGVTFGGGITVSSQADARTDDQVAIAVELDVATEAAPARRRLAIVPASKELGGVFLDVVEASFATTEAQLADGDRMDPWRIEYRTRSANGGKVVIAVDHSGVDARLVVDAQGPVTSLMSKDENTPAYAGDPFETIYGLVNFTLSGDEFDFFATRAYGITAGAGQNFADFRLLPHDWLRLTVTPELADNRVDVAFEVVTTDGRRLPVARAPASLKAGEQFMQNVLRLVKDMNDAEAAEVGSSMPWRAPFYYDDPEGGGIVEVIARGEDGRFGIAYAVETPARFLRDVEFIPYQGAIEVPEDWDRPDPTCTDLGTEASAQGTFLMSFEASPTVRNSDRLTGDLRGRVVGSVYRAEDVTIGGPNEGAEPVATFDYADVDATEGPSAPFRLDAVLNAGAYQILGFMDVDDNADAADPNPDPGDPVMIPIGGFELTCREQPVVVEFALLLPEGF